MSNEAQPFVLNTHLFANVTDNGQLIKNTKAGWQSSAVTPQTQANIRETMKTVADWITKGIIKDGDIITTHTQVNFTTDAAPMQTTGLTVNGNVVEPPETAPASDDEPDVPF